MHIALISLGFPPYSIFGGLETYVSILSKELTKNGISVTVISGWPKKETLVERSTYMLKVIRLPLINKPIRNVWYQLLNKNIILDATKKVDIIHSNSNCSSLLNRKIMEKKPIIMSIHGSLDALLAYFSILNIRERPFTLSMGDLFYLMEYPVIRSFYFKDLLNSDALIFVAQHAYEEAIKYLSGKSNDISSKSTVVYAGVDINEIRSKGVNSYNYDGLEIAYAGRLFWPKGITYVLKAFNVLVNDMGEKKARLHVLGDGPLKKGAQHFIKQYKLKNNVILYGQKKRDFVIKILSKCNVALFPSLYEGCPYFLLEANALGIPVVTFDLAWSREFIINGLNGYRSPPFSIYNLAENVLKATNLRASPIKKEAEKYDIHLTIKKVVQIYQSLSK
jgi:glycosyltransferase involved in cell wall biosynthesis